MKIQAIQSNVYSVSGNKKTANVKSAAQPTFEGNYYAQYKSALTRRLKSFSDARDLFEELATAVKSENVSIGNFSRILGSAGLMCALEETANHLGDNEIRSSSYPSPLVTFDDGEINFHHPINGEYGNGNITFWLNDDNEVCVSRPADFSRFYPYGCLKEHYDNIEGGGIMNHKYYTDSGKEDKVKNFFLG